MKLQRSAKILNSNLKYSNIEEYQQIRILFLHSNIALQPYGRTALWAIYTSPDTRFPGLHILTVTRDWSSYVSLWVNDYRIP